MASSEPTNRRRSERVMLHVPVTVLTETLEHEHLEEATHTLVVNAHGGLMKLTMELLVGQPITLRNHAGAEQGCRVVRVDQTGTDHFAVAFEFDQPAPKFWPVVFPPKDWELPGK